MNIRKGQIFYCDMSPTIGSEQGGLRPCLIVSNDIGNKYSPVVIVAPLTSANKKILPTHVFLSIAETGMRSDSTLMAEQIRTIDKRRLRSKVGEVRDMETMKRINEAIRKSLEV